MNPITGLRKLGIRLVGDNGLLSAAAMKSVGLGPLKQLDLLDQAKKRGLADVTSALNVEKTSTDILGDQQKIDQESQLFPGKVKEQDLKNKSNEFDLNRSVEEETSRKAAIPIIAQKLGVAPEAAEGTLRAIKNLHDAGQIDLDEETAKLFGLKPGVQNKEIINLRETVGKDRRAADRENRLIGHQEEMDRLRLDRESKADKRAAFSAAERIKSETDYKADIASINAAQDVADALSAGIRPETTQLIITKLNKMTDPGSVVRESEYARTAEGRNALDRIRAWINRTGGAGGFPKDILEDINRTIQGLSNSAKTRHKDRVTRFKNLIKEYSDGVGDDYLDNLMPSFDKPSTGASKLSPAQQRAMGITQDK